jgi:hypothetical protein
MTIMLTDAPGGRYLIAALTEAAKDLSLIYANSPDDRAQASLRAYLERIRPELVGAVGTGPATQIILDGFASAVMSEKRRMEAEGVSRA